MSDRNTEEDNWIFAGEKCYNFVRVLLNFVSHRGGSVAELERIFTETGLVDEMADVFVGKSKIIERDPLEIICSTGRTSSVKAEAALKIEKDEERIRVLPLCSDKKFVKNIISGMKDPSFLFSWYKLEANANRNYWSTTDELDGNWITIIESFTDEDLVWILKCGHHWDSNNAIKAIRSQELLKSLMNDREILDRQIQLTGLDYTHWITLIARRIDSFSFLNNWLEKELTERKVSKVLMQNIGDRVRDLIEKGIAEES